MVPLSAVANLCLFFGLGVILYYIFYLFVEKKAKLFDGSEVVAVEVGGTALPFFFANALYCYEGIGMVVPVCLYSFYYIHAVTSNGKQDEDTKTFS